MEVIQRCTLFTLLHCLYYSNSFTLLKQQHVFLYILKGRLEHYWNGLIGFWAKSGSVWLDWTGWISKLNWNVLSMKSISEVKTLNWRSTLTWRLRASPSKVVHSCTIFLFVAWMVKYPYRNPNMNNKDHRVWQLAVWCTVDRLTKTFFWNFQTTRAVLCYILIDKQMLH